jgi:hypothetical protein
MTLIRVSAERAGGPREAVLEVLNTTRHVDIDGDGEIVMDDVYIEDSRERDGRTFWLWRLVTDAPRCVLSKGRRYAIEDDTGAVRRTRPAERWVVREGVAVRRRNGAIDIAINESLAGSRRLVDETVSTPTGAFRSTVL